MLCITASVQCGIDMRSSSSRNREYWAPWLPKSRRVKLPRRPSVWSELTGIIDAFGAVLIVLTSTRFAIHNGLMLTSRPIYTTQARYTVMSVLLETTLGEFVVDLMCEECPLAAKNFLKLCKAKYYNNVLIYNVQQNFMIQTGDPTGTGRGGTSIYGLLYGEQAKFFEDEIRLPQLKHNRPGLVCMASGGENKNTSQFYITMRGEDLEFLDGKHTIFGEVAEGLDTVLKDMNELYCDTNGRPYRDVRILHTYVLEDPFIDPPGMADLVPAASPLRERPIAETVKPRLIDLVDEEDGLTAEALDERIREAEAKKRAVVLEMIGDLPDAEIKPPENVLFVCKLNAITTDEDLEIIFSRFGPGVKAEICRDAITGDSLNYAFVEFDDVESCEEAYKKMDNALIDDRRIKVDFSQSVAKQWNKYTMRPRGSTKIKSRGKGFKECSESIAALPASTKSRWEGNYSDGRSSRKEDRKRSRTSPSPPPPRRPRSRSRSCERWDRYSERHGGYGGGDRRERGRSKSGRSRRRSSSR